MVFSVHSLGASMKPLKVITYHLIVLSSSLAMASGHVCKLPKPPFDYSLENCQCESWLARMNIKSPYEGLQLHGVCNYKKEQSGDATGNFYFKGEYVIVGDVTREENSVLGDYLTFSGPKIKSLAPFYESSVSFRFENNQEAFFRFKTPKLSRKHPCWTTKAKIVVTDLYVLIDGGTDFMGNYPTKYRILDIGKYKACKPSDNS